MRRCQAAGPMRLLIREGQSAEAARAVLQGIASSPRHEFRPDNASYHDIPVAGIIGHRQVTDAYLAHLAHLREMSKQVCV